MKYATAYDIGDRKRSDDGINEDSIHVAVFEDGHREGYERPQSPHATDPTEPGAIDNSAGSDGVTVHGPGDEPTTAGGGVDSETKVFPSDKEPVDDQNRKAGIFVLADGAGGEESGDIASYIATVKIAQELSTFLQGSLLARPEEFDLDMDVEGTPLAFDEPRSDETFETALEDAIASANEAIVAYANADNIGGLYTTVVAGVYVGNQLHYGWVGDSRIYVINRSHEEIAPLTKDHAKITRLEDEGEIGEVEAHVHPDGNEIDRALGGGASDDPERSRERTYQMVETNTIPIYNDDTVLLTSDGLIDAQTEYRDLYRKYIGSGRSDDVAEEILEKVVTDDLIRDVVLEAESLQAAANEYVRLSNEKGGKDNISVVLFGDHGLPDSPPGGESGLPERSIDPDQEVEERQTIIRDADSG